MGRALCGAKGYAVTLILDLSLKDALESSALFWQV